MAENVVIQENTSGLGKDAVVPQEVLGIFNWGAFCLSWIWGIGNSVWLAFIALALNFIPFIGGFACLAFCIWLGVKGNELAWQSKKWNSVEHFHSVQKIWAIVGIIVFVLGIVLGVIVGIALGVLSAMSN